VRVSLKIEIVPSPDSNDHEVLLLGDGRDLIRSMDDQMMGLDPDDLLIEPSPLLVAGAPRVVTIGRCSCGETGCGSVEAELSRQDHTVAWSVKDYSHVFTFDAAQYEAEIQRALADASWETPDRTAARLIRSTVDRDALARHGFRFSWSSGRLRIGKLTVSLLLEPGPYQVLVHSPWIRQPETAAATMCKILSEPPSAWRDVEYYPQAPGLGAPSIDAESWRLGPR
jgi:hypothetical protein